MECSADPIQRSQSNNETKPDCPIYSNRRSVTNCGEPTKPETLEKYTSATTSEPDGLNMAFQTGKKKLNYDAGTR